MDLLVNIDVDDLDSAVEFYGAALGLKKGRRLGESVVEMVGGTAPVYLLEKAAGSTGAGTQKRDYGRHWTPVHLDFVVKDIRSAVKQVVAAGARIEADIRTHDWGHIAQLADPFGNGFCLLEFRGRGYDEIVTAG